MLFLISYTHLFRPPPPRAAHFILRNFPTLSFLLRLLLMRDLRVSQKQFSLLPVCLSLSVTLPFQDPAAEHVSSLIDTGMFPHLSSKQLLSFADTLMESHKFARSFNTNYEQRTVLWKAGIQFNCSPVHH